MVDIDIILPSYSQQELLDILVGNWNLSDISKESLQKYYLLYWSMKYFRGKKNFIFHQGINYVVRLIKPFNTSDSDVVLSFRKPYFMDTGIVLVRSIHRHIRSKE